MDALRELRIMAKEYDNSLLNKNVNAKFLRK